MGVGDNQRSQKEFADRENSSAGPLVEPRYRPYLSGRFKFEPGFVPLGRDIGGGPWDSRVFQITSNTLRYGQNKLAARTHLSRHVISAPGFDGELERSVSQFMRDRLCLEYPAGFVRENDTFVAREAGLRLDWDLDEVPPPFHDAFDALASLVPEDLAVWSVEGREGECLSALHVSAPNHWAPEEKIGQSFMAVHDPVPHLELVKSRAREFLDRILASGPFVRLAWGIASDDVLNQHPLAATGRTFGVGHSTFLRIERQCLFPLRPVSAVVFTIRTYFQSVDELSVEEALAVASCLGSMDERTLVYKGLADRRDRLMVELGDRAKGLLD
jgi:hypothetical protein